MTESAIVHGTFVIDRTYAAPPEKVFAAFADERIKRRWFAEGIGSQVDEFSTDFRVGGGERSRFRFTGGVAGAPPPGTRPKTFIPRPEMLARAREVVIRRPRTLIPRPEMLARAREVVIRRPKTFIPRPGGLPRGHEVVTRRPKTFVPRPEVITRSAKAAPRRTSHPTPRRR
jgi:hypothetical protein